MNRTYHKGGTLEALLPAIELAERSREISENVVMEIGKLAVETLLGMSAAEVAGEPRRGKAKGDIRHHGSQQGRVYIAGRRLQVDRPRLRTRGGQEVPVPIYEQLKANPDSADRALKRVLSGISTRGYKGIFDEAGKELGLSKSNVSRAAIKAAEEALKDLTSRPIERRQLVIYVDGVRIGGSLIACAVGVDEQGTKRQLGLSEGATENAATAGALLDSIIERGVDPQMPVLFVIDGSKALRSAIASRFKYAMVQRCRVHKIRNVTERIPKHKRRYVKAKLNVIYGLEPNEALARLHDMVRELEITHPGAAASLREGLKETLTVSFMNLSPLLASCLGSTNIIEESFSKVKTKLRRFTRVSTGAMAMRWCAAGLVAAEQRFRTIKGYVDLWMLQAILDARADRVAQ